MNADPGPAGAARSAPEDAAAVLERYDRKRVLPVLKALFHRRRSLRRSTRWLAWLRGALLGTLVLTLLLLGTGLHRVPGPPWHVALGTPAWPGPDPLRVAGIRAGMFGVFFADRPTDRTAVRLADLPVQVWWSPGGQRLATRNTGLELVSWRDPADTAVLLTSPPPPPRLLGTRAAGAYRALAGGLPGPLEVFETRTGVAVARFEEVVLFDWSPTAPLLAVVKDDEVRVYNNDWAELWRSRVDGPFVFWSPDGNRILLPDPDGSLTARDGTTGTAVARVVPPGDTGPMVAGTWSPDGSWAAGLWVDGTVLAGAMDGRAPPAPVNVGSPVGRLPFLSWSDDGRHLAISGVNGLVVLEAEALMDGTMEVAHLAFGDVERFAEWSPDSGGLAFVDGRTLRVLETDGWQDSVRMDVEWLGEIALANWREGGTRLMVQGEDSALMMDIASGTVERVERRFFTVPWSSINDGDVRIGGQVRDRFAVVDVESEPRVTPVGHLGSSLVWSPDGERLLAYGGEGGLRLLRVGAGGPDSLLRGDAKVEHVAWNRDGSRAAVVLNDGIRLLDPFTGDWSAVERGWGAQTDAWVLRVYDDAAADEGRLTGWRVCGDCERSPDSLGVPSRTIPDDSEAGIEVSRGFADTTITDVNEATLELRVDHTFPADLSVQLQAPDGQVCSFRWPSDSPLAEEPGSTWTTSTSFDLDSRVCRLGQRRVAWSPVDPNLLMVSEAGRLTFHGTGGTSAREIVSLEGLDPRGIAPAWSTDGGLVAAAVGGGTVRLVSATPSGPAGSVGCLSGGARVRALGWTSGGHLVTATMDDSVRVYATGAEEPVDARCPDLPTAPVTGSAVGGGPSGDEGWRVLHRQALPALVPGDSLAVMRSGDATYLVARGSDRIRYWRLRTSWAERALGRVGDVGLHVLVGLPWAILLALPLIELTKVRVRTELADHFLDRIDAIRREATRWDPDARADERLRKYHEEFEDVAGQLEERFPEVFRPYGV